jgi:hypothetical protein
VALALLGEIIPAPATRYAVIAPDERGAASTCAAQHPDEVTHRPMLEYVPAGFGYGAGLTARSHNESCQLAFSVNPGVAVHFASSYTAIACNREHGLREPLMPLLALGGARGPGEYPLLSMRALADEARDAGPRS